MNISDFFKNWDELQWLEFEITNSIDATAYTGESEPLDRGYLYYL